MSLFVLLSLTVLFENFEDKSIRLYKLDTVHFCFALGLSWQPFLKMTVVEF